MILKSVTVVNTICVFEPIQNVINKKTHLLVNIIRLFYSFLFLDAVCFNGLWI